MKKVYGNVGIRNNILNCSICGMTWIPDNDDIDNLVNNRSIDCPFCKLTNNHPIDKPIDKNGTMFFDSKSIRNIKKSYLNSNAQSVVYFNTSCGHKGMLRSSEIPDIMKNPRCLVCEKKTKMGQPKTTSNSYEIPTKPTEYKPTGIMDKADTDIFKGKKRMSPEQKLEALKGKIFNKSSVILGYDKDKGLFNIACIHCGARKSISPLAIKSGDTSAIVCDICNNNEFILDELINKHIGTIHNGFLITKIFEGENGITLCDVECIHTKTVNFNNTDEVHRYSGIHLYDLLYGNLFCEKCAASPAKASAIIDDLIKYNGCKSFRNKFLGNGYNSSKKLPELDLKTLMTSDICICDYCYNKGSNQCRMLMESSSKSIIDSDNRRKNFSRCKSEVAAEYPNIYNPRADLGKNLTGKNASKKNPVTTCESRHREKLLVFRDAFEGRDGKLYKFCKCAEHKTELILNESEIEQFDCSKYCTSGYNPNQTFWNIPEKYLPGILRSK